MKQLSEWKPNKVRHKYTKLRAMSTLQADSKFKWLDKIVDNLLLALSKSEGKVRF